MESVNPRQLVQMRQQRRREIMDIRKMKIMIKISIESVIC
jgi:hypothetical protein